MLNFASFYSSKQSSFILHSKYNVLGKWVAQRTVSMLILYFMFSTLSTQGVSSGLKMCTYWQIGSLSRSTTSYGNHVKITCFNRREFIWKANVKNIWKFGKWTTQNFHMNLEHDFCLMCTYFSYKSHVK